jgi:rhamnose transport system substrate-binding protein
MLRRRGTRMALVAAAVPVLLLTVSGCGSSSNSSTSSSSTSSASSSASSSTSGGGGAAGKKVAFIETNTGNPYNDAVANGFKKAATDLGFSVDVVGPDKPSASAQIPFIQQAIVQHVDVIAIDPNDPATLQASLQQAQSAGIKILEVNADSLPKLRFAGVTALDYSKVAAAQVEELGKLMNYKGDFAILSATPTAVFQKMVVDGEQKILSSDPKYKDMHLLKVAYGNDIPADSTKQTQALLAAYPSIQAITSPTTVGIAATAQAIESAGKAKKIIVTGLGLPSEMKKYVLDGTVQEFQLWDPYSMGLAGGYAIGGELSGTPPTAGGTLAVPSLGSLTISSTGVIYAQNDLTTFTADTINNYKF